MEKNEKDMAAFSRGGPETAPTPWAELPAAVQMF